jgi:hypothetical protein
VLGLIGDIASCIGNHIKEHLRQPFIEKLIIGLQNDSDPDSKEIAQWALQQIKNALQA